MLEKIGEFLASLPRELYVFLISILPIIELRGAIPVGAALGLPFYINYGLSVLGNLLPVPFILAFIPFVLDFMARFKIFRPIVEWLRKKADKHKGKIIKSEDTPTKVCSTEEDALADADVNVEAEEKKEAGKRQKKDSRRLSTAVFVALILFVAVPLPGTGAWTGSLVAALFDLPKRSSFLAVALGVLISGVVMCLASYGVVGFLSFLL